MVDVLRAVRRDPALNAESLETVLTGVPPAIDSAAREWAHGCGNVDVYAPDARFREFRLAIDALLPEFVATMDALGRKGCNGLLCVLDSHQDRGLDDVEARALLNVWIRIDFVHRIPIADGFRILAGGRFRDEHLGIAFTLDSPAFGDKEPGAATTLEALEGAGIVPAVLFIKGSEASHLTARTGPLARCIERVAELGAAPGVSVDATRPFAADTVPVRAAAVRRGWTSKAPVVVRYDSPAIRLQDIAAMQVGIHDAGGRFDASMMPAQSVDEGRASRPGAYLLAGAYTPQRFDLRTPAGEWKGDDALVELVAVPYGEGLWSTWESARRSSLRRLERLLDYFRIESYMRRITDIGFAQRYHEFRVYNWGIGDPNPRTLLLDCGSLADFDDVGGLIRDSKRLRAHLGERCHTHPGAFFDAAVTEARARTVSRSAEAIRLQHDEHEYLETIDAGAPLRADVANFASWMPASVGATLELGAGFGQLASHLRARATSYVALDLQASMLSAASRMAGARGVIGDFHRLPFRDALFDSVIANNVLEHAYDPLAALREIYRTLKRGGALYALIPLDALNPLYQLPAHLWKTDLPGIQLAAEAAGLDVEAADPVNLYAMDIPASFPSCNGLVCRLRARRPWSF